MNKALIERLDNIPITELFKRYDIQWEDGRNFRCPFPQHQASGRTPSARYYPKTNSLGCFGCHKGGGPIHFVRNMEGISYKEAVETLANWYGFTVENTSFSYDKYLERLNSKADQYIDQLKIHSLTAALASENLTPQQEFNLWYLFMAIRIMETTPFIKAVTAALHSDREEFLHTLDDDVRFLYKENLQLLSELTPHHLPQQRKFNPNNLFCGYLEHSSFERWQKLDGRYIFPVFLPYHILPGFAGRALDDHMIKYWTYFDFGLSKTDVMYGLDVAADSIRKEGFVILVEGILDVLRCRSLGIMNVVAPLSTYMSETHYHLLSIYTDKFLLCFDSDYGGRTAAEKSIVTLDKYRREYEVVELPEGEDPDSIGLKSSDTLIMTLSNKWR